MDKVRFRCRGMDVVSEVFSRSGSVKDKTHRGIMACELSLFLTSMPLYMGPERCPGGSPNNVQKTA